MLVIWAHNELTYTSHTPRILLFSFRFSAGTPLLYIDYNAPILENPSKASMEKSETVRRMPTDSVCFQSWPCVPTFFPTA